MLETFKKRPSEKKIHGFSTKDNDISESYDYSRDLSDCETGMIFLTFRSIYISISV